jgi:hypothetical protein
MEISVSLRFCLAEYHREMVFQDGWRYVGVVIDMGHPILPFFLHSCEARLTFSQDERARILEEAKKKFQQSGSSAVWDSCVNVTPGDLAAMMIRLNANNQCGGK